MAVIIILTTKNRLPGPSALILWLPAFFLLGYFLRAPSLAASSAASALRACAASLIPALFPFIVLVGILSGVGIPQALAKLVGKPIGRLFGMSPAAAYPILMGALGGFPIGAVCTRELYEQGQLSRDEAERLCTFTNNASPAFCIGGIGASLMGDASFGLQLYLCQLAAAFFVGILQRRRGKYQPSAVLPCSPRPAAAIITDAITSGGITMLKICSFAVFFAVVGDAACLITEAALGERAAAVTAAIFELTLGARRCAELGGKSAKIICAAAVGWSGLSVQMQISSILSGSGIRMKRCYCCKLISAVLMAGLIGSLC
ncbi:MAG: hypothetical protein E7632_02290 [Ruminococcaceae bacterium]|nr:hypothetical protein [Oscillospiraceae bacterium]